MSKKEIAEFGGRLDSISAKVDRLLILLEAMFADRLSQSDADFAKAVQFVADAGPTDARARAYFDAIRILELGNTMGANEPHGSGGKS